jgi:hypothetical protein
MIILIASKHGNNDGSLGRKTAAIGNSFLFCSLLASKCGLSREDIPYFHTTIGNL